MPGLLTDLFASGDDDGYAESRDSSDTTFAADTAQDAAVDEDVDVTVGGNYENLDGSTTSWSSSHHVGVEAQADVILQATGAVGTEQIAEG